MDLVNAKRGDLAILGDGNQALISDMHGSGQEKTHCRI